MDELDIMRELARLAKEQGWEWEVRYDRQPFLKIMLSSEEAKAFARAVFYEGDAPQFVNPSDRIGQ